MFSLLGRLWLPQVRAAKPTINSICWNVNNTTYDNRCLLLYLTRPLLAASESVGTTLTWSTLLRGARQLPTTMTWFVDIHPKTTTFYSDRLAADCIKIAYMTSSHSAHRNSGERGRLDALERRRGVRLLRDGKWNQLTMHGFVL